MQAIPQYMERRVCRQPAGIAVDARFNLDESPWRSCKGGMMAGMSSLVRIVNAGVPGSQDRVDVVLRDGVVASVGPAGTVSASDSTMQTKAHTTRWNTRRMPLLLAASQSQRRPPHPPTKPPSTPTACGLFPACGTATRTSRNGLRRWADWTSSMPVPPPKRWTCCAVIWMSAAPPTRLTQMPSWWACDSVTRCGPTTSSPHWPQLTP